MTGIEFMFRWVKSEKRLKDEKKLGDHIILDRPVEKIHYDENGVKVVTKAGKETKESIEIEAMYAISTIPLGVLQREPADVGYVTFDPPFPKDKLAAIKDFKMGNYEKIYVQFDTNFWGDKEVLMSVNIDRPPSESIMTWGLNLDIPKYFPGSKMLTFHCMGITARRIANETTEKLKQEVYDIMNQMFPGKATFPTNLVVTTWTIEPFSYGSWSAMPKRYGQPGFSKEEWSIVRRHEKMLFFAGEHTSYNYGFVHSAYQSGHDVAEDVLIAMGKAQPNNSTARKFCPTKMYDPVTPMPMPPMTPSTPPSPPRKMG